MGCGVGFGVIGPGVGFVVGPGVEQESGDRWRVPVWVPLLN